MIKKCKHTYLVEQHGKYFLVKCEKCGKRLFCDHFSEKYLICEDCIDMVRKAIGECDDLEK